MRALGDLEGKPASSADQSLRNMLEEMVASQTQQVHADLYNCLEDIQRRLLKLEHMSERNDRAATDKELSLCDIEDVKVFSEDDAPRGKSIFLGRASPSMLSLNFDILDRAAEESYRFSESVWDITLFIGTDALGLLGSAQALLLLMTNIFMHIVFVGIAMVNFLEPAYGKDDVESMQQWRETYGHAYAHYDGPSGSSLVSRVCGGDKSLLNSAVQSQMLSNLREYLSQQKSSSGLDTLLSGQLLCLVALLCWFLMVFHEIHCTVDLLRAVACLPLSSLRLASVPDAHGQVKYRILSLSKFRLLLCLTVTIYRLGACAFLLYCGLYFLAYTPNITELILNAVALEIILKMDDLIFMALAPAPSRFLIHSLEPLRMRSWPRWRGLDVMVLLMTLTIPIIMFLVSSFLLNPTVLDLSGIIDVTCAGAQDFVVGTHVQLGVVFALNTSSWTQNGGNATASLARQVVKSLVDKNLDEGRHIAASTVYDLDAELSLSTNDFARKYGICRDIDNTWQHYKPFLAALKYHVKNDRLTSCAAVTHADCSAHDKPLVRFACPTTCGCDDIYFGSFIVEGCPFQACSDSKRYLMTQRYAHYEDVDVKVLTDYRKWNDYLQSVTDDLVANLGLPGSNPAELVQQTLLAGGCAGLTNLSLIARRAQTVTDFFCQEGNGPGPDRRSLCPFCPVTCKCQSSGDFFVAKPVQQQTGCEELFLEVENYSMLPCGYNSSMLNYSSPNGFYVCIRDSSTGRRMYRHLTENGTWEIAYHASLSLHGYFLGAGVGLKQKAKWVLSYLPDGGVSPGEARYFALANKTEDAQEDSVAFSGWLPRNALNSDDDCATGTPRLRPALSKWVLGNIGEFSCTTICQRNNMTCNSQVMAVRSSDLEDDQSIVENLLGSVPAFETAETSMDTWTIAPIGMIRDKGSPVAQILSQDDDAQCEQRGAQLSQNNRFLQADVSQTGSSDGSGGTRSGGTGVGGSGEQTSPPSAISGAANSGQPLQGATNNGMASSQSPQSGSGATSSGGTSTGIGRIGEQTSSPSSGDMASSQTSTSQLTQSGSGSTSTSGISTDATSAGGTTSGATSSSGISQLNGAGSVSGGAISQPSQSDNRSSQPSSDRQNSQPSQDGSIATDSNKQTTNHSAGTNNGIVSQKSSSAGTQDGSSGGTTSTETDSAGASQQTSNDGASSQPNSGGSPTQPDGGSNSMGGLPGGTSGGSQGTSGASSLQLQIAQRFCYCVENGLQR
eukprot:TRINITY_DN10150_c0_g1_i2.p1 TRINITY_DN10150_c0_g1~~TRINITY_DN10150_c0_g1_i2.p1  ORF type:complete len:1273 (+),score=160.06 TRINITY_DN10150_c0_g1_i2:114-3821(+)